MSTLRTRLARAAHAAHPEPPIEIRVVFVGEGRDEAPAPLPGQIVVDLTRRPA